MNTYALESALSPRRRLWLLVTAIVCTAMFSWSSVNRLAELVKVQQIDEETGRHSLLELTEQNIASHLHLPHQAGHEATSELVQQAPAAKAGMGARSGGGTAQTDGGSGSGGGSGGASSFGIAAASTRHSQQQLVEARRKREEEARQQAKPGGGGGGGGAGELPASCNALPHTDYWGDALVWGNTHRKESAGECCRACQEHKPPTNDQDAMECNVWVYCGDKALCGAHHKECWLKHLAHPLGTAPAKEDPDVGWTTGVFAARQEANEKTDPSEDRTYHVVITAQGTAVHWQSRVHYYWFKKVRKQCRASPPCHMGEFTRVLHSGRPDDLMGEIPTFVAQPLPKEHPDHGYVVLNRPYALLQWARQAKIKEKYVLMGEPDHVWLKPMPNLMVGRRPAAFPFFYIEPSKKEFLPITAKFVGPISRKEAENIAPIGNSPAIAALDDLQRVFPLWFNMSIAIHSDPQAAKEWGWVQEMYAFTLSCYKGGIRHIDLHLKMMAQPPYDTKLAPFYLLHFTYGMDYTLAGEFTPGKFGEWRFDKRSYAGRPPPRGLGEPPAGMKNELVRHLIHALNEATAAIPGWDEYEKTGRATQLWDGKV